MKRGNHSKSRGSKALVMILAVVLLVGVSIGGTIAWLTDKTDPVVNTFTVGNINIELKETDTTPDVTDDANTTMGNSYKMIPGYTITKDPVVTVKGGSEACWVFVKVDKSATLDTYIAYTVDTANWTALADHDGVYYKKFTESITADTELNVLTNKQVTVKDTVTKALMDALNETDAVQPTLTFTAYACQLKSNNTDEFTADAAWHTVCGDTHPVTP